MDNDKDGAIFGQNPALEKPLDAAARRALEEAELRRQAGFGQSRAAAEIAGRQGPEPVRYGDWEVKGMAVDF